MKPIKLKIKGLNSFIDSQDVDFERLTDKGLFGIFGPTGCGKSTILDGITLALYGEVARKSSNFMNTNCDSLNVSFEFQISGKEIKRYRVEREFRRDNKNGSIRSKSAKIVDITDGIEEVLEDGAKTVTSKCEEIIGLQLEDFSRTVVLPQGKFSEFLKLEGKDRRNMLERLFNLQKYGDELSSKLASQIREERQKEDILHGELKGYENISEVILEEKTKTLLETNEQCDKYAAELKDAEDNFNKGKELWELQNELKEQINILNEIKEKENEIKEDQRKVVLGESVLKVKPYIDGYESTLVQMEVSSKKLLSLTDKIETIKENKEKAESAFSIAKNRKDKELPELKIKEQKVIDAIGEKILLDALIQEKSILEKNIISIEKSVRNINDKIIENEARVNTINNSISVKEEKVETLRIPEEYKKRINEGILILNRHENMVFEKNKYNKDIKVALASIEDAEKNSKVFLGELKETENLLHINNEELTRLLEACPGDQNTLLNLQENLSIVRDKWNKYGEYEGNLKNSYTNLERFRKVLENNLKEKVVFEQKIDKLNDEIKKIENENLAHTLREALSEGEPCPVCGSENHNTKNIRIIDSSNLEQLKDDLSKKEKEHEQLKSEIIKMQTQIRTEEGNIELNKEKINELGEDFKSISVEVIQNKLDNLKANIDKFNSKKTELENKNNSLNKEKGSIEVKHSRENTILTQSTSQLGKLEEELKVVEENLEKISNELVALKSELLVEDFNTKSDEISEKEKEKTSLEKNIKLLRDNLKLEIVKKEALSKEVGELREELGKNKTTLIEKSKNIEEKQNSIISKVGNIEDLQSFKKEICDYISKVEAEYEQTEKYKNEIEVQYSECNNNIISIQSSLLSLKERSAHDKEKLEKVLIEEGIKDIETAKNSFIIKTELERLKLKIEEYKSSFSKLSGAIENLKKKMNNKSLAKEQWIELQNLKDEKTLKLKELEENKIKLRTEVENLREKLVELNKLLKKKEELDYKLSLLDDLEKLFKGKRFVEYVAANQLKYISIEACKKLKEISGGNYGLEVDENGRFIIRDYKNGGAQRDASTLSGGETFIASLALALALSSQIQLKGTAPLELFFLDEGFGTLDDNLLDVVMDSLEKIHNERLSIGIISHVESIKNRVPVKLIVTAAEAGMGGSKVKIERS